MERLVEVAKSLHIGLSAGFLCIPLFRMQVSALTKALAHTIPEVYIMRFGVGGWPGCAHRHDNSSKPSSVDAPSCIVSITVHALVVRYSSDVN